MNNTLKTFLLMAALSALFMVIGRALGGQQGMVIALLLAVGLNFLAYWNSDKLALSMNHAREVSVDEAPDLHALVASLAQRAGIPKPRVYVVDAPTPNAFATGRNPEHAAVAVTTGLIQLVDRRELEGVVAHELGHIKNRDILIASMAAVMAGAISYLVTMAQWTMLLGGNQGREGRGNIVVLLISILVAPVAASMIQMAISRSREYIADATGAQICGHPEALASALDKLSRYNEERPMNINPASAQMYIVNPLKGSTIASLFATHPPMEERIRRLLTMRPQAA